MSKYRGFRVSPNNPEMKIHLILSTGQYPPLDQDAPIIQAAGRPAYLFSESRQALHDFRFIDLPSLDNRLNITNISNPRQRIAIYDNKVSL